MIKKPIKLTEDNSAHIAQLAAALALVKTNFNKAMHIGSANKGEIACLLEGSANVGVIEVGQTYRNADGTDSNWIFGIPLPFQIYDLDGNAKNLIITQTILALLDADAGDYVDRIRLFGASAYDTVTALVDDNENRTAAGEYTYNHADQTLGGSYERAFYLLNVVVTDALDLDITYLKAEYYYG